MFNSTSEVIKFYVVFFNGYHEALCIIDFVYVVTVCISGLHWVKFLELWASARPPIQQQDGWELQPTEWDSVPDEGLCIQTSPCEIGICAVVRVDGGLVKAVSSASRMT